MADNDFFTQLERDRAAAESNAPAPDGMADAPPAPLPEMSAEELEQRATIATPAVGAAAPVQGPPPELWTPSSAAASAFLFSVVFGAALHAGNWRRLGKPELARKSQYWVIAGVIGNLGAIVGVLADFEPLTKAAGSALFLLFLLWFATLGQQQIKYVQQQYGTQYRKRSWVAPLVSALTIFVVYLLLLFMIVMGSLSREDAEKASPGQRIAVNESELFFTDNVERAEAKKVAKYLREHPELGKSRVSYQLDREGATYFFRIVIKPGFEKKEEVQAGFRIVGYAIANEVLGGVELKVQLCNDELKPLVTLDVAEKPTVPKLNLPKRE